MWRTLKICWQWNSDFQAGGFLTFYPERNIGSNLEPASVAGLVKIIKCCFGHIFQIFVLCLFFLLCQVIPPEQG
jgi:hypothetical protein